MDKREMIINNPKLDGQVGESAVWNGPLSKKGFPMGHGSSSGITGMEVSKYPCELQRSTYNSTSKRKIKWQQEILNYWQPMQ